LERDAQTKSEDHVLCKDREDCEKAALHDIISYRSNRQSGASHQI